MESNPDAAKDETKCTITILIATLNAGAYLEKCLTSIAAQQTAGIEILVMDGGSSDDTLAIMEKYKQPALHWFSESDKGIYDALNKGIQKASGRWLYFLGADDRLLPGFSQMVSRLQSEHEVYYGIPDGYYTGEKKPDFILLGGEFSNYRMAKYCLNHQAIIYPAAVFKKYQFQLKYRVLADYALNLQVWGDRNFKKIFVPIPIASYHMAGFSAFTKDEQFEKDKPDLIKSYLGRWVYWRWQFKKWKKSIRGETF